MTNGPCADVLEIVIKDLPSLHAAYMSSHRNGELFISITQWHELGDEAQLLPMLLDDCGVSYRRHSGVGDAREGQGIRPAGIGVEFAKEIKPFTQK